MIRFAHSRGGWNYIYKVYSDDSSCIYFNESGSAEAAKEKAGVLFDENKWYAERISKKELHGWYYKKQHGGLDIYISSSLDWLL